MKITGYTIYRYALPFKAPVVLRTHRLGQREGLILCLIDEGRRCHYGEIAPLVTVHQESLEEALQSLSGIARQLLGLVSIDIEKLSLYEPFFGLLPHTTAPPSVVFGVEQALLALLSAAGDANHGLSRLVISEASINIAGLVRKEDLFRLGEKERQRISCCKVKVGGFGSPGADVAALAEVMELLPVSCEIRLDANQGYSRQELVDFLNGYQKSGYRPFTFMEEPCRSAFEYEGMDHPLARFALDESLWDQPPQLKEHIDYYVLKPTRIGGLSATMRWLDLLVKEGKTPVLSSCYESDLTVLSYLQLAHAAGVLAIPLGLGTYDVFADTLVEGASLPAFGRCCFAAPEGAALRLKKDFLQPLQSEGLHALLP